MNPVSSQNIAIGLAVIVALGLLFLGPNVLTFFFPGDAAATDTTATDQTQTATTTNPSTMQPLTNIPSPLPTTLTMQEVTVGTGAEAKAGDTVTVNYIGQLPDGTVFDASANHGPFSFTLGAGQVIPGWDQGVAGMKVGGTRILVIPPALAYGSQAVGNVIPANATLVFQVELVSIGQ
jgi:FKBP-type peptidyl-prolyl cis-trans isomerase